MSACELFKSKDATTPSNGATTTGSSTETTSDAPLPPVARIGPGPSGSDPSLTPIKPVVTASPVTSAVASASASAVASAGPPPSATVEIKNDCPDTLHVFLGDKPKGSSGNDANIPGRSVVTEPRASDGSLTLWILDGKGNGVTSAHAQAGTKRIEIGIDCRTLMSIE